MAKMRATALFVAVTVTFAANVVAATAAGADVVLSVSPTSGLHPGDLVAVTIAGEPSSVGSIVIMECGNAYGDGTPLLLSQTGSTEACSRLGTIPGVDGTTSVPVAQIGLGVGNRSCIESPPAVVPCMLAALGSGGASSADNEIGLSFADPPSLRTLGTQIGSQSATGTVPLGDTVGVAITIAENSFHYVPDGTVYVTEGASTVGTASVGWTVSNPRGFVTVAGLGLGEHVLTAHYAGNGSFMPVDGPPMVVDVVSAPNVSIGDSTITNGSVGIRTVSLNLALTAPSVSPVTVSYQVADGTARAGIDYVQPPGGLGSVTFLAGRTGAHIHIRLIKHALNSGGGTFTVTLLAANNGYAIGRAVGTTTILNNSDTGVSVGAVSVPQGDSGPAHVVEIPFVVQNPGPTQTMQYLYLARSGTAVNGDHRYDFHAATKIQVFGSRYAEHFIRIPIFPHTGPKVDKQFVIGYGPTSGSQTGAFTTTITILG